MNADESLQSGHLAEINNEKVIDENDKTDEQGSKACAGVAAFSSALRSGAAWKRKIFVPIYWSIFWDSGYTNFRSVWTADEAAVRLFIFIIPRERKI